jgi:MFS family permease
MTLGRLTGDALTARAGAVALVRGGALVAVVGLGGALAAGTPAAALAGFACLGIGTAVVIPSVFRAAASEGSLGAGPALAVVSTAGYAGFLAGPPVIGAIAQATSLRFALGLLPALAFVVALLAGAVRAAAPEAPDPEPAVPERQAVPA